MLIYEEIRDSLLESAETVGLDAYLVRLFTRIMNHRNLPTIKWEVIIPDEGDIKVTSVSASHYWHIEFLDEPIDFEEIFEEIVEVLKSLKSLHFIRKKSF